MGASARGGKWMIRWSIVGTLVVAKMDRSDSQFIT